MLYEIVLSTQERRVIKNLLQAKISDFENEIQTMNDPIGILDRKIWIKNYRNLIKRLNNSKKINDKK